METVEKEIRASLENYFEAMHSQDMECFDSVFHENVTLYSAQGNELVLQAPRSLSRPGCESAIPQGAWQPEGR
jgi:hypothetical protein